MIRQHSDDGTPACICVVDDDAAVRLAMCNLLDAGGHGALAFESGEALLDAPDLAAIGAAIFDVKLRGMNGFVLLERFRERGAALGLDIPVLLVSGHSDRDMEQRAMQAGALALLRKPVDPDLLFDHIEQALTLRRTLP
jgi:FixJ family two-component response regulator